MKEAKRLRRTLKARQKNAVLPPSINPQ